MALGIIKVKLSWREEKTTRVEKGLFGNKTIDVMSYPAEVSATFQDFEKDQIDNYVIAQCSVVIAGYSSEGISNSWYEVQVSDLEMVNNAIFKFLSNLSNYGWETIHLARKFNRFGFNALLGEFRAASGFIWSTGCVSPIFKKQEGENWECIIAADIIQKQTSSS